MRTNKGFTLIEIAIVMVLVGLLLGSVLKGQELITTARVRNISAQLDSVKIAYLGFQDRFRAYPGDVPDAVAANNIPNSPPFGGGCGVAGGFCGNGRIDPAENLVVWMQIARSGFINETYGGAVGGAQMAFQPADMTNSPSNPYGGFLVLVHDKDYGDVGATSIVLNIKTGGGLPAGIVAELDRKLDDGIAGSGVFRTAISYGNQAAGCTTGVNGTMTLAYANADVKSCGGVAIQ